MIVLVLFISVLACWTLCGATLVGIGATVSRWLKLAAVPANFFWLGVVAAVPVLETYHLFRRIDLGIACLLFLWGVVGQRKRILRGS